MKCRLVDFLVEEERMTTWLEKRNIETDVEFKNYTKEITTTPRKRTEQSIRSAGRAGLAGIALAQVAIRIFTESDFPILEIVLIISLIDFLLASRGGRSVFEPIVSIYGYIKDRKKQELYPCQDCLIVSTCIDFCNKVDKDLTTIVSRFDKEERCIDCGNETCNLIFHTTLTSAGMNTGDMNLGQTGPDMVECARCGHLFYFDKFAVQRMQHFSDYLRGM